MRNKDGAWAPVLIDIGDHSAFPVNYMSGRAPLDDQEIALSHSQAAEAGAAVVYTSHYLAEFEELGADIAILEGGRIVVSGTLERVVADHSRASIALGFARNPRPMDGWRNEDRWLRREGDIPNPGALIADALASPALRGNRLEDVRIGQAGLQSAYLAIVGEEEQDNA